MLDGRNMLRLLSSLVASRMFLLLFLLLSLSVVAEPPNKYRQREASDDVLPYPNLDEEAMASSQCPQHLELRWQTEVSSSIYASPLIADINGDGKLDIVVPSFVHNLEVLDGSDGEKLPGWPVSHQSTAHSSPLMFDIDKDGVREIALATYNGEVLFFRPSGYMMMEKLVVPRTREKKDWYAGLKQDHADQAHPDVNDDSLIPKNLSQASATAEQNKSPLSADDANGKANSNTSADSNTLKSSVSLMNNLQKVNNETDGSRTGKHVDTTNFDIPSNILPTNQSKSDSVGEKGNSTLAGPGNLDVRIDADTGLEVVGNNLQMATASVNHSNSGVNSEFHRRLLEDAVPKDKGRSMEEQPAVENVPTAKNEQALEDAADASFAMFRDEKEKMAEDGLTEEYQYDYDDYTDEAMWGHEDWKEAEHEKEEDYVNIDAHILCTPVIADIDKDGVDEMIIAVSYFFDREYYDKPEHAAELGGLDINNYVKSAIVVFNLDTKEVKWTSFLDVSTDQGSYRAYVYSSPSVVDLDGDGYLDIVVGTSYGYCYALDHHGQKREKFPLQMADIQGQVLVADINDDGKIELVATDTHGNVAAWSSQGMEIWEVHLKSLIAQGPTAGDVDGDGHTDVVVPTVSGKIFVLKGLDGSNVNRHPFHTHGRVMAPVLLMDTSRTGDEHKGLLIVVTSFDGYLYLIDGQTACADAIDIGETSYSMVLAENVDGGNDMELIVTTMNGNVFCFSTPVPYHPLKAWPSQNQGRNLFTNRYKREGIFVVPSSRTFHDEEGDSFWLKFNIIDQYRIPSGSQGPYNVTVTLLVPGNYMGSRKIVQTQIFSQPGVHKFRLPCVPVRTTGTVLLEMVDRNGLYFSDEFVLTFHMHYYRLLKWLIVLPMLATLGVLVFLQPLEASPLPSFSRDRHEL